MRKTVNATPLNVFLPPAEELIGKDPVNHGTSSVIGREEKKVLNHPSKKKLLSKQVTISTYNLQGCCLMLYIYHIFISLGQEKYHFY